jgi:hypothetical protein
MFCAFMFLVVRFGFGERLQLDVLRGRERERDQLLDGVGRELK